MSLDKNYTIKELDSIELMGSLFFSLEDIAAFLQYDKLSFVADACIEGSDAYMSYNQGWLKSEIKLRQSIMESAENGSNPAQAIIMKIQQNNAHE